jgi:hypothetical protein
MSLTRLSLLQLNCVSRPVGKVGGFALREFRYRTKQLASRLFYFFDCSVEVFNQKTVMGLAGLYREQFGSIAWNVSKL